MRRISLVSWGSAGQACVYPDLDLHLSTHPPPDQAEHIVPPGAALPIFSHLDIFATYTPHPLFLSIQHHLPGCISSHSLLKALWAVASTVASSISYFDLLQTRQAQLACQLWRQGQPTSSCDNLRRSRQDTRRGIPYCSPPSVSFCASTVPPPPSASSALLRPQPSMAS